MSISDAEQQVMSENITRLNFQSFPVIKDFV